MNEFKDMNGLEVLWLLLTTEPFFWVLISIGVLAIGSSWWCDNRFDNDIPNYPHNDHLR